MGRVRSAFDYFLGRQAPPDDGMGHLRAMMAEGQRIAAAAGVDEDTGTLNDVLKRLRENATLVSELPIVYACFRLIAQRAQATPLAMTDGGTVPGWIRQPNGVWSWADCVSQMIWSLLIHGEMFLARIATSQGRTAGFVVLDPNRVQQVDVRDYQVLPPQMFSYNGQVLPEVYRTRFLALPGRSAGYGPGAVLRRQREIASMSEEAILRHFRQGARFQTIFTLPGEYGDEAFKEADRRIRAFYTGIANWWRPPVLTGDVKAENVSMTADEAQYLQLSQWTEAKIAAQIFGPDPTHFRIYLAGSNLTYANMRDLEGRLWRDATRPAIARIEEGVSRLTATGRGLDMLEGHVLTGGPHDRAEYATQLATINRTLGLELIPLTKILEVLQLPPTEGPYDPLPSGPLPQATTTTGEGRAE